VTSRPLKGKASIELPAVSERRPLAFPIESAPNTADPILVYAPRRGEWTIAERLEAAWVDRGTGQEIQRLTRWMPLPELP
jgi:hypothetical protein